MSVKNLNNTPVLVVGAGIMGAGIAQVAAQAGHPVMLFDMRAGAAVDARNKLASSLQALVAKGKLGAEAVTQTLSRISAIAALQEAAGAGPVVEAIVEKLDAKRGLFRLVRDAEGRVSVDPTGKRAGRGAYLCGAPACWERAVTTDVLNHALRTTLSDAERERLRDAAPQPDAV